MPPAILRVSAPTASVLENDHLLIDLAAAFRVARPKNHDILPFASCVNLSYAIGHPRRASPSCMPSSMWSWRLRGASTTCLVTPLFLSFQLGRLKHVASILTIPYRNYNDKSRWLWDTRAFPSTPATTMLESAALTAINTRHTADGCQSAQYTKDTWLPVALNALHQSPQKPTLYTTKYGPRMSNHVVSSETGASPEPPRSRHVGKLPTLKKGEGIVTDRGGESS